MQKLSLLAASVILFVTCSSANSFTAFDLYFGYGKPNTWGNGGIGLNAKTTPKNSLALSLRVLRSHSFQGFRGIRMTKGTYRILCTRGGKTYVARASARNGRILSILPQ